MATAVQSLLAVYGALDRAVTGTGDPEIEAIVERYLPGSTGANAGWYDELLGFLGVTGGPDLAEPIDIPDLGEALETLQNRQPGTGDDPEPLTTVQLSRMAYAIGALSNLPGYYRPEEWDSPFAQTFGLVGTEDTGSATLELMRRDFNSRDDWSRVVGIAAARGWIQADVAVVPQCDVKVKSVDGHLCAVLTTDFSSDDVSLDSLKNVVDPLNWANCLQSFFCTMEGLAPRPDGWSRVREYVSTTCPIPGSPRMMTALKYWKGQGTSPQLPAPSAWVNYDLDDQPLPGKTGDGRMVVDEGFIRMTSTVGSSAGAGVHVRTKKIAGFRNLAWIAGAIFACAMGYGAEGVDMLLGGVALRPPGAPPGWTNWQASTPTATTPPGQGGSSTLPTQPTPPGDGGDTTTQAVTVAVDMLNECIDDMSKKSAAIAAKWATGKAPIAESVAFNVDLATRLATDPWRYLERLRAAVKGGDK
jgi:hypothetical protein